MFTLLGLRAYKPFIRIFAFLILALGSVPGSAQFAMTSMIKFRKGFFVVSAGTTRGNMGGLSGANTFCFNDLTANNWMGKPTVSLDTAKVRAFLCDGSACNNPLPNQYYQFASAGFPADGGALFQADNTGGGPNDSVSWGGATYFNAPLAYFWTNRAVGTSTRWGTTPASTSSTLTCNNWTTNAGANSVGGDPASTISGRWNDTIVTACNTQWYLICMVDP